MQEWKIGSENVWKTVRTENKNSHQLIITDSTHPISKERLKLDLSNLVHREAISSLIDKHCELVVSNSVESNSFPFRRIDRHCLPSCIEHACISLDFHGAHNVVFLFS